MRMHRLGTSFTAAVLAVSLFLSGCGGGKSSGSGQAPSSGTPKQGGTITIGKPTDAISLDPHEATTAPEVWIYNNIYESLVTLDDKLQIQPGLAEKWERVNDTTMRFHLKQGVKFQDGTPFNAEAVKFTIERTIDPKKPARGRDWLGPVTGAKVIDENTVDIITDKPFGPLVNNLSMVFVVGIVSPTAVQKYGDDFGRHPVGTGPFKFVEWQTNDHITLARNDEYWGQKPYLDKVIYKVIPEEGARTIAFDRGNIDFLLHPAPADLPRLEQDKNVNLVKTPGLRVVDVGLNNKLAPTNDPLVRQAISHIIDVKGINDFVVEKSMNLSTSFIAPNVPGYKDEKLPEKYNLDPSKAEALLKQAGYNKGADGTWAKDGKPLELTFWFSQGRDMKDKEMSEAVQAQLTKFGIKVNVQQREWGAYLTALRKSDPTYNLFTLGWVTVTGDSDFGLYTNFHTGPIQETRYSNSEVDGLLDDARTSLDQNKRNADYQKVQDIVANDVVWIPLYLTNEIHALKPYIKGYVGHPGEYYVRMNGVWLDK